MESAADSGTQEEHAPKPPRLSVELRRTLLRSALGCEETPISQSPVREQ